MFRAIKQHVTGTYHGKQRHGNLLVAQNKSPLLTMSQKGSENIWHHVNIASYKTDSYMAGTELEGMLI